LQLIFQELQKHQLAINEIEVNIKLSKAIYFAYNDNKSNGAFILIDAATIQQQSRVYKIAFAIGF
jgi:sulfate adenylyltransferase subunit 1 (EFTu-like GTPase family)